MSNATPLSLPRRTYLKSGASLCAALAAAIHLPSIAQSSDIDAVLLGRWDLSLIRKDGDFQTVWLFEKSADGKLLVATIGPNQIGLSLTQLSIARRQFIFTGMSALGSTALNGNIDGDKISGAWEAGSESGQLIAKKRSVARVLPLLALFDRTIAVLEAALFTTNRFNDEWQAAKQKARSSITEATLERELVLTIRQLLRVLKLSHMGFYALTNANVSAMASAASQNNVDLVFESRMLPANIAYLKIKSFAEGPAYRAKLDEIFAGFKNANGLVLDLRGNSGGTLNLAMRVGDHLFDTKRTFGVFATRAGLEKFQATDIAAINIAKVVTFDGYALDDFQRDLKREGALSIASGGRGASTFTPSVAVLQNERCASTTEALLATLKETSRARLFGVKTAGAMLSSAELVVADGYVVRLAYADFRTLNGKSLEGIGVSPDEMVENGLFGDKVLDRAVAWVKAKQKI